MKCVVAVRESLGAWKSARSYGFVVDSGDWLVQPCDDLSLRVSSSGEACRQTADQELLRGALLEAHRRHTKDCPKFALGIPNAGRDGCRSKIRSTPVVHKCATHGQLKARQWLVRHRRWTFHASAPTLSVWLNAVDGVFAKLTMPRLKRRVFVSVSTCRQHDSLRCRTSTPNQALPIGC
jgi:hypothetical protein